MSFRLLLCATATCALPALAAAQCQPSWQPFVGGGANARVRSMLETPAGLVAAGEFTSIGGAACSHVAIYDGITWQPLGGGTNDSVRDVVRAPNGDLIAGGSFTAAGGQPHNQIARWDGAAWTSLGGGSGRFWSQRA